MQELSWKTQIAVLWLLQTVNYAALILITRLGTPEGGADGDGSGIAMFFFIPCLLAWLVFVLKPAVSRWMHIVFGSLFALLKLVATVMGVPAGESFGYLFNEAWGFAAAAILIWLAWRAPKTAA
jgi:hypothetical protein